MKSVKSERKRRLGWIINPAIKCRLFNGTRLIFTNRCSLFGPLFCVVSIQAIQSDTKRNSVDYQ